MFSTLKFIVTHPLAGRKPLTGLARYARWQIESRLRDSVTVEWVGGARLVARNGMTGATGNIYCGLHEFSDMGFLLHFLRVEDLFVDVGANIGSYTILAAAVCGASALSIEPDEQTADNLRINLDINSVGGHVEVCVCALGDHTGAIRFTVGLDTVNHVATADDMRTREVPMRRLDDIIADRSPHLLKMDVEGYEAQVIAGAIETLHRESLLAIITEGSGADVRGPIEAAGFQPYSYEPFSRTLTGLEGQNIAGRHNALFIRNSDEVKQRILTAPRRSVIGVTF